MKIHKPLRSRKHPARTLPRCACGRVPCARDRARAGVTLLEMLIALALMGMLASALYMSLHIGFRANATAERALAPARSAAVALELMRRDLESALPPTGILAGPFLGEESVLAGTGQPADIIQFHTLVEDFRDEGPAVRLVEFTLDLSEDAAETRLVRRETANLLAPTTPEPTEEVLCRNVVALEINYFDGFDWTEHWDSTERGDILPRAVEVRLVLLPEGARLDADETYEIVRLIALPCAAPERDEDDDPIAAR